MPVTRDLLPEKREIHTGAFSHSVHTPLCASPREQKRGSWLTSRRLGKYQVILLGNPNVTLKAVSMSNHGTLLPTSTEEPIHDHIQITEQVYPSCPDLMCMLLEQPDCKVVIDESSFMDQGQGRAGYAS